MKYASELRPYAAMRSPGFRPARETVGHAVRCLIETGKIPGAPFESQRGVAGEQPRGPVECVAHRVAARQLDAVHRPLPVDVRLISSDRFCLDLHHKPWIGETGDKQQRGCRGMVSQHGAACRAESRQERPVGQEYGGLDYIADIHAVRL